MMSKPKWLRGLWRLAQPVLNSRTRELRKLPRLYLRYVKAWRQYIAMNGDAPFDELAPFLFDDGFQTQSGGGHYFYQDIWALRKLAGLRPAEHHDVGSRLDGFVGQATVICPVIFWDIRMPTFELPRLTFQLGSILNLPLPDESVCSLSCLHVVEHVGLGRYGDKLDPSGFSKALRELTRVLARSGQLLVSLPIGKTRVSFNAHRVLNPVQLLDICRDLRLVEFSAVNDSGQFVENTCPEDFLDAEFSCGLYHLTKD